MFYYIKLALSNYFNFKGRATRKELWFLVLTQFLINLVIAIIGVIIALIVAGLINATKIHAFNYIHLVYAQAVIAFSVLMVIPGISLAVRRFHDIGRSGWWLISPLVIWVLMFFGGALLHNQMVFDIGAIVFVASILAIFAVEVWPSQESDNKYGPYVDNVTVNAKPLNSKTLKSCFHGYLIIWAVLVVIAIFAGNFIQKELMKHEANLAKDHQVTAPINK